MFSTPDEVPYIPQRGGEAFSTELPRSEVFGSSSVGRRVLLPCVQTLQRGAWGNERIYMNAQTSDNGRQQQQSPLKSELGTTTIQDSVVLKVAGIAAQEVEGIRMGSTTTQTVGNIMSAVPSVGSQSESRGVSVEVGEVEAAVDLSMSVEYGRTIHQIAESVRTNVIRRVESLVGLRVTEVNITVSDIFFPQQEQQQEQ